MTLDEYLKLWVSLVTDMRVIFAVVCLFVLGALLRFIAFGRKSSSSFKRPILKLIQKVTAQKDQGSPSPSAASDAGNSAKEEDDDVGLTEEEYPTEEDEEGAPKQKRRR